MEPMRRRPQGVVAKLLAQQPLEIVVAMKAARGNQNVENDAPEQVEELDEESGEDGDATFDGEASPSSSEEDKSSMATPPSSPENHKNAHDPEATEEWEVSSSDEPAHSEQRDSENSETDTSLGEDLASAPESQDNHDHADHSEQQQHLQLQSDVVVLAAHLQQQTLALTHERSVNQSLQTQLVTLQQTLAREIQDIRIENDALRHENARLQTERDASTQHAQTASETHDELLRALRVQQQRDDHARTIIAALVKERDTLKKQLDESKTYCRRLEEDVVALRAETQQLRAEMLSLQTAVKAASSHRNGTELKLICEQERTIQSLCADVLQMEFEYRTMSVDKDTLSHRVATLQRQSESRSTSYDVISLRSDSDKTHAKKAKRFSVVKTSKDSSATTGNSGGSFTNLTTLPNCVDEGGGSSTTIVPRPKTPMGSLVSKTISSAKKKLFQSSSPSANHTSPVVLPQ